MNYPNTIPHWINGKELSDGNGIFPKYNPANGQFLGLLNYGSTITKDGAILSAQVAFNNWSTTPLVKRGEILRRVAELMENQMQEIAEIVVLETGKSPKDALGEVQAAIELGFFMAGEGRRFYGQTTSSAVPHRHAYTIRQPVGICALITAANTPIANVAWKTFPALICGNTAIMKPAEHTPYTATWFAKILKEAGLPNGVFSVLQGAGGTGKLLVEDERIDLISFTGSVAVGRYIQKTAGERLARVCLELGGKNPLIVCDDANLDWAVENTMLSAFSNAGQRCASASRIIIFSSIYDEFKDKLVEKTSRLKIGPTDNDDFGPLISEAALNRVLEATRKAVERGAVLLTGGYRLDDQGHVRGNYLAPTILEDVSPDDPISQTELFGPVTCLYRVNNLTEAVALANNSLFGLTGAIHTKNIHRARFFVENYRAGVVSVNGPTYGSEPHLPFGGLRNSGTGWREPGTQALDVYSEWKTVYERYDPNLI